MKSRIGFLNYEKFYGDNLTKRIYNIYSEYGDLRLVGKIHEDENENLRVEVLVERAQFIKELIKVRLSKLT